ncbi:hypothetical protein SAMN05518863_103311 [Candidatus Pantoea symbiotica]|uniref:Uncharacterized protein n=1 Tax=Candidatus Pantoea symbiotica TaxID=1884370 RepID=A0A1I3V9B7_9GAMM|nr:MULTISPECIES: hypothetical protein [Pantoea]SFJ91762.1 hypothetical protein SAMN05518863_103311 [Pantoea symbiotica]SFU63724.1 hypothetical protein SAMN05518864_103311 [Pantoea sp. YR525]
MEGNEIIIGRNADGNVIINNTEHGDLTLISYEIIPSSYNDMINMKESGRINVKLHNVITKEIGKIFQLELTIANHTHHEAFLLVKGGWIPCSLMKEKTLLLADRNIISEIKSRYFINEKKIQGDLDYFDAVFLSRDDLTIDITLWVLESNERKIPSVATMNNQCKYAKEVISRALPEVEIAEYPDGNNYYHNASAYISTYLLRRANYLLEVAPSLNKQFTEKTRSKATHEVFELAKKHGLKNSDIVVILAFLRINMSDGKNGDRKNTAKKVLKDSQNYSAEDAYNTASDLGALEWLINLIRHHEKSGSSYNVAIITKDIGLAELGVLMLNEKDASNNNGEISIKSSLPMGIFSDSLEALMLIKKYL